MRSAFVYFLFVFIVVVAIAGGGSVSAQKASWLQAKTDTNYISDHSRELIVRVFALRKHTNYTLDDRSLRQKLQYSPNKNYNLGLGFNYRSIGINLAFNFPLINNDNEKFGRTRSTDIQPHIYLKKLVIDLYAQFYHGFYLSDLSVLQQEPPTDNYLRPDLRTRNIGLSAQYIFNGRRFSFRSPFVQSEIQKKSAGSILAGVDAHTILVRADSSVIPGDMHEPQFFDGSHFNRSNTYSLIVNVGYAYTYVYKKHYFATAGFNFGIGADYMVLIDAGAAKRTEGFGLAYNTTIRLAAGYNSQKYFIGAYYVGLQTHSNAPAAATRQDVGAGIIRFVWAKRIKLKRSEVKKIDDLHVMPPNPLTGH